MLFTSYYGQMKKFPSNFIPVSISLWKPKWYTGAHYPALAPTKEILSTWKANHKNNEKYWEKWYTEQFEKQILRGVDAEELLHNMVLTCLSKEALSTLNSKAQEIQESEEVHVVFLCYEKDGDFCHRSLVSEWLCENKIPCKEATQADFERYGVRKEPPQSMVWEEGTLEEEI